METTVEAASTTTTTKGIAHLFIQPIETPTAAFFDFNTIHYGIILNDGSFEPFINVSRIEDRHCQRQRRRHA
ncbi:hypothetical protein ONZ45_g6345 [Pleurotus djamor]|nr:hypothetical protein ONZ45_g6345 [Pleurotus djamor]